MEGALTEREQFVILLDHDRVSPADAIIFLEGDGESRSEKVIALFQQGFARTIVFSGGLSNLAQGSFPASMILPKLLEQGIPESSIVLEEKSQNTREQALEVLKLAQERAWKSIILVASHYHHYRAFLTFLKVREEYNSTIIISSAPASQLPWFKSEPWGNRFDLLEGEFERIEKYGRLGHIASYRNAVEYLQWKELQP